MSLFDTLIVQPIFNLLALIYGLLPGNDFGISLILFTVLVRLAMWPLVRRQLHQTKLMRALQPELKRLKAQAKGDRQKEASAMMELYRERGIKPFASFGLLFLQLPIFIALYRVIQVITTQREQIASFTYAPIETLRPIADILSSKTFSFDESLLGIINLTQPGVGAAGIYLPAILLAAFAAALQFVQSKQITPKPDSDKRLRDVFRDSAAGKDVDQSELSSLMMSRMIYLFPLLTFGVGLYLPGALTLYFAASSAVAVIQQHLLLNRDVAEMEEIADEPSQPKAPKPAKKVVAAAPRKNTSTETTVRVIKADEAGSPLPAEAATAPARKAKKKKRRR